MEENNIPLMCINCIKDNRLKLLVQQISTKNICSCCGEENFVIDTESNEFGQMIKALIRYHYSEWEYNTHLGGDRYYYLLINDPNVFFNTKRFLNIETLEDIAEIIESFKVYEDYDKGVSIFAGYNDYDMNMPLRAIKNDLEESILKIGARLKNENYFLLENEMITILKKYEISSSIKINKGTSYYRARIGYEDKQKSLMSGWEGEMIYVPYSNSKIGAPPPYLTQVGRLNRQGVSFLYCATDKYTAIAEIRTHPGDIVSLGKFLLKRELKIFDLSDYQFLNFYTTDEKLDEYKFLNTLSELMNKVVPPAERQHYSLTQLISDCTRQLGFDGILFNSSVGLGNNIVIFNPNDAEYTFDEVEVVEIKKVSYEYITRQWIDDVKKVDID